MSIENVKLVQECSYEHLRMGPARIELNGLNCHFRNNAYNSVRCVCIVSPVPKRKKEVPFNMARGNGELVYECFP